MLLTPLLLLLTLESAVIIASSPIGQWEFRDCRLPSSGGDHPVGAYSPYILNLRKQSNLSPKFWFMFSGLTYTNNSCGFTSGQLYLVTKKSKNEFVYTLDDKTTTCPGHLIPLAKGSYGFISCAEEKEKAVATSQEWWHQIPTSYIMIILIIVGVAFVVVAVVGTAIGIVWRRKSRRAANLTQSSSKNVAMRPITARDDSRYTWPQRLTNPYSSTGILFFFIRR